MRRTTTTTTMEEEETEAITNESKSKPIQQIDELD
jgi:hypothetical protein